MAKKKSQKTREKKPLLDNIPSKKGLFFTFLLLLIIVLVFYQRLIIQGLDPAGGDVLASIGAKHQLYEYREETGKRFLWNPNIFCGVPLYFGLNSNSFHFDTLIRKLNPSIDWTLGWFLIGIAGLLLLFRELKFPWYFAAAGGIAFIFLPHFQALILVGHASKLQATMAIPIVLFSFIHFTKRRNLFSLMLFTLFFALQLRTKHYQIIFYTLLLLLTVGIYIIIKWAQANKTKQIFTTLGMFIGGLVIAVLMSAQPLFVAREYTPYSTRGGNAIQLSEEQDQNSAKEKPSGVSFDYATRWSFSPGELMTLICPRFFGGTSQEVYTGNKYSQLQGRRLPTYWGDLPFTQSTEYMGIIVIILGVLGICFYRRNGLVISLTILLSITLLLSFGRHFPPLYKLLFLYLPYFSKFRVPMMILILSSFLMIILAGFGIKGIINQYNEKKYKMTLYVAGFFTAIGLLFLLFPNILSFTSPKDSQYASNPQVMQMLKSIRKEYLQADLLRMLGFIIVFTGLLVFYYKKQIKKTLLLLGITMLIGIDIIGISYRFLENARLVKREVVENRYFAKHKFDHIIEQNKDYYRVLGLGQFFQSNRLAYRHQLMGGYSAIKPQLIQDIIDNNLYRQNTPPNPLNWNVINMCNAKYIISPGQLKHSGLTLLATDESQKARLYRNENALPRVYFVQQVNQLDNERQVLWFMNSDKFNPARMALTSESIEQSAGYDTTAKAKITQYTPNRVSLQVNCKSNAFMVLADAYFPIGWQATIDQEPTHIYQVNHMLRGIEVPAGEHEVVFRFRPKSYQRASLISNVFTYLVWIVLLTSLVVRYRLEIKSVAARLKSRPGKKLK